MARRRFPAVLALVAVACVAAGALAGGDPPAAGGRAAPPEAVPDPASEPHGPVLPTAPGELPHDFAEVAEGLYRSAQPVGDAAFAALAAAGIRVLVSVDGARPDVEAARRHGLRYVHLPFGYDGIPAEQALRIVKTVSSLEGPFLFHCHHGKHRGPAASALALRAMTACTPEEAAAAMRAAGASPAYRGLWRDVARFESPGAEALEALAPEDLPEMVQPQGMVQGMVDLDQSFERMTLVRKAGWRTPREHPDVDPAHEALILAEGFRELGRLDEMAGHPERFRALMSESEALAWDLVRALRGAPVAAAEGKAGAAGAPVGRSPVPVRAGPDRGAAARAFEGIARRCADCHAAYRDER